jgi:hypothetical protein
VKDFFSTIVERALQKNFFLQNKAKLTQSGQSGGFSPPFLHQKSTSNFTRQKNEPNSNPNEPNFLAFPLTIYVLAPEMKI